MELIEMEKRLLYQTEGCERYAVIKELSMASQYVGDPARRKAAISISAKRAGKAVRPWHAETG